MSDISQSFGRVPSADLTRTKTTLIFNRLNGVFISATDLPIDLCDANDLYCIYTEELMDLNNDEVAGSLIINEDGSWEKDYKVITHKEATFKVHESQMNAIVAYKITKKYTVVDQINILARLVKKLADEANIDTSELDEYVEYIRLVKDTNKAHREFYISNPNVEFITNEEQANRDASKYEGGLHEIIGPRTVGGGTVF